MDPVVGGRAEEPESLASGAQSPGTPGCGRGALEPWRDSPGL